MRNTTTQRTVGGDGRATPPRTGGGDGMGDAAAHRRRRCTRSPT